MRDLVRARAYANRRAPMIRPDQQVRAMEDTVAIRNDSGTTIPQYGIVWLVERDSAGAYWSAEQIDYPAVTSIGIATAEIAAAGYGRAWVRGEHPVLCSDYASVVLMSRLSTQAASFYATAAALGLLLMVGDHAQPGGLPAGVGLVRVRIDNGRPI
jgi:hypothetical protein